MQEQLNTIAKGLDDCIGKYEQYFKIEYSNKSYVDNKLFNEDWKNAKEVLKVIGNYSKALDLLDDYDHRCINKPKGINSDINDCTHYNNCFETF